MKKYILMIAIVVPVSLISFSLKPAKGQTTNYSYMMVTTVESVVKGGMGRSQMLVTTPEGKSTMTEMMNLYSMTGVNFENLQENSTTIIEMINKYISEGWELSNVSVGAQTIGDSGGIYMTRYLFRKIK